MNELKAKGLLGKIQRRVHEGMNWSKPIMTIGSLNFPEHLIAGVNDDTAPKLEAILRKARADITELLETK